MMSRCLSGRVLGVIAGAVVGMGRMAGMAQGAMFGVTNTDLYRFDFSAPTTPVLVGSLGLPSGYLTTAMAFHEGTGQVVLLTYRPLGGDNYDQDFYSVNVNTGAATLLANVGQAATKGFVEGLDYDRSRGSLIGSTGGAGNFTTASIIAISLGGAFTDSIAGTGRDNDIVVYDSTRGFIYGADTNGGDARLYRVDNGALVTSAAFLADPAYDAGTDSFYGVTYSGGPDAANVLYRLTTDGVSAGVRENLGAIAGINGVINSLVVVPEPGVIAVMAPMMVGLLRRR